MGPNEASELAHYLEDRFGLPLSGRHSIVEAKELVELRPLGVHPNDGFLIRLHVGWRTLTAEMIPGAFARELVWAMGETDNPGRSSFAEIARVVRRERGDVQLLVNDVPADAESPETWPQDWHRLSLTVHSPPLDPALLVGSMQAARHWSARMLAMVVSLAATGEDPTNEVESDAKGLPEGARTRVEVNRYERSRANRAICIEANGARCRVCGFDFELTYGPLGDGFVHVHHITPLSRLTPGYLVNPVRDLIPVCPNCHAMLHRTDPPLSPEELRRCLEDARQIGS